MIMKRYFILLIMTLTPFVLPAQNDDSEDLKSDFGSYKASLIEKFYGSKKKMVKDFEDFRDKAIAEYVEFVRRAWEEFNSEPAIPVPEELPVPPIVMPHEDRLEPRKDRPFIIDELMPPLPVAPQPQPVVEIKEIPMVEEKMVYFTFFGTNAKVRFDVGDKVIVKGVDENAVADAIERMARKTHDNMLFDCLRLRKELRLSDWAYLQMLVAVAKNIHYGDDNSAALLVAYLYMQSGYKVRIGANEGRLYMLFACEGLIYNRNQFTVGGCNYYGIEELPARMHICEASWENEKKLSLVVNAGQRFAFEGSEERCITSKDYPGVSAKVMVNKNLMSFYDTYPTSMLGNDEMTRWALYANTGLDENTRKGLYPVLQNHIAGLSEVEAVDRLLNFVQTGLVYGYDNEIWGEDRVFFAEESLFYPYCDCEDRSVLFSRLVRDLLGLDVALVMVPGHMLTAVNLKTEVKGAHTTYNGKKFIFCEPTCTDGAPVGWTDIEDGARLKMILLDNNGVYVQ